MNFMNCYWNMVIWTDLSGYNYPLLMHLTGNSTNLCFLTDAATSYNKKNSPISFRIRESRKSRFYLAPKRSDIAFQFYLWRHLVLFAVNNSVLSLYRLHFACFCNSSYMWPQYADFKKKLQIALCRLLILL